MFQALFHFTVSRRMEKTQYQSLVKLDLRTGKVLMNLFGVFLGVNGAVNGSGVCPPTTLSGSFPASSAPVQTVTKPTKSPDSSNSHRASTENCSVEMMEKPIPKPKEKASPLT